MLNSCVPVGWLVAGCSAAQSSCRSVRALDTAPICGVFKEQKRKTFAERPRTKQKLT